MKFKLQSSQATLPFNRPKFKSFFYLTLVLFIITLCTFPINAQSHSFSPYVLATDSLGKAELTHLSSDIEATLDGDLLNAEITQVYENKGESTLECECMFPLTEGQFLGTVEVRINGKVILEEFNGEFLILEVLPHDKVELTVNISEVLEPVAALNDLI